MKVAYEDIRIFPDSSLLHELDKIELQESNEPFQEYQAIDDTPDSVPTTNNSSPKKQNPSNDQRVPTEAALWAIHPNIMSFFFSNHGDAVKSPKKVKDPTIDIGKPTSLSIPAKDDGDTPVLPLSVLPTQLEAAEQTILRQLKEVLCDVQVSESRLEFAPRWVIDKAIQKEKDNFRDKKTFREVRIQDLPKNANLISSHCFFQVKLDAASDRLKLKCRLVPHGNRDRERITFARTLRLHSFHRLEHSYPLQPSWDSVLAPSISPVPIFKLDL